MAVAAQLGVLSQGVHLGRDVLLDVPESVHSLQQLPHHGLRSPGWHVGARPTDAASWPHATYASLGDDVLQLLLQILQPAGELLLALTNVVLHEEGVDALLRPAQSHACIEELLEARCPLAVEVHDGVEMNIWDVQVDAEGAHDLMRSVVVQQRPDLSTRDLARAVHVRTVEEHLQCGLELFRLGHKGGQLVLLLLGNVDDPLHNDADHEVDEREVREDDHEDKVERP
mmetsp:Transcript_33340/g.70859  ORF Transcript_33340/g.70859 Transcript_33340/m.70859 type:complete len:228 (-) Transcript_33340:960-1643(-)